MPITLNGDGAISGLTATGISAVQNVGRTNLPVGTVLQVVQGYTTTGTTTTSSSPVDTTLSASITPTSASSKILVLLNSNGYTNRGSVSINFGDSFFYIVRGSTQLTNSRNAINFGNPNWADMFPAQNCYSFLDSPATTSSTTYKMQIAVGNSLSFTAPFQSFGSITLMEIAG
jgi:hypothetical protein